MILGIGCDIVGTSRFRTANMKALKRIFDEVEIKEFGDWTDEEAKSKRFASCFALKEAISKAARISLFELGVLNIGLRKDKCGAPYVELANSAREKILKKHNIKDFRFHVSLSHGKDSSIAFVILEKL